MEDDDDVSAVRHWVQRVIVGLDFCPWAGPAESAGRVRVVSSSATTPMAVFEDINAEALRLPQLPPMDQLPPGTPTTTLLVCGRVSEWHVA